MKEGIYWYIEKIIILLAIIGSIFWVNRFLPSKALVKNIYPSRCFGQWTNPDRAVGSPDVSSYGDINEFNSENSAFYQTGFQTIICDGFEKTEGNFISAKLGLSLAIGEIKKEPENLELIPEEENLPLPIEPESPPEPLEQPLSLFYKIGNFLLKIFPVFAQEEPQSATSEISPDVIFNLRYLIGENNYLLNTFSSYPISNATNNGYFYFDLPEIKSFSDLENLKISLEGLLGGEPHLTVWLDSLWLEVEYKEKPKIFLEVFQKFDGNDWEIFANYQGKEIQLTNNDFDDKFPNSDNENEIVWQSQINSRWQIFYLNLNDFLIGQKEPIQITQTKYNNISPKVSNGKIIWQAWLDNNWEIMIAEKTEEGWQIKRLTENEEHDLNPYFSQDEIFWQKKTKDGIKNFKATKKENEWEIQEIFNQKD
ncbi:MAG: hypothetical protein ACK413_03160 [Patescibacteria group bacterium]